MTNALYLFLAYPHWLIVTGTVLLILGLIGLALFSRRDVEAELNDMASDQGPSEPEAELAQTQAADRKTKLEEQKRDRWADKDRGTKEPLNDRPKIHDKESR
jgi:hypothetical protein